MWHTLLYGSGFIKIKEVFRIRCWRLGSRCYLVFAGYWWCSILGRFWSSTFQPHSKWKLQFTRKRQNIHQKVEKPVKQNILRKCLGSNNSWRNSQRSVVLQETETIERRRKRIGSNGGENEWRRRWTGCSWTWNLFSISHNWVEIR